MSTLKAVLPALCIAEGGYSNRKADRGGETFMGISKRQYPGLEISKLTEADVLVIYQRDFWDKYRIGEIQNQTIAQQFFLAIINMPPISAGKIMQRAINRCNPRAPLVVDGVIGTQSINVINTLDGDRLITNLKVCLCEYYLAVVDLDSTQLPNFQSWIRRALM